MLRGIALFCFAWLSLVNPPFVSLITKEAMQFPGGDLKGIVDCIVHNHFIVLVFVLELKI